MRKLTADFIHTGNDGFKEHRVLILDSKGRIEALLPDTAVDRNTVEYYPGIILPGFINAHCHLELSHLRNQFDTGTRLIPFLRNVVQSREWDPGLILEHIQDADVEMQREGIVAVGDISNKTDTLSTKEKSPIRYHSFVEAFDFLQDHMAQKFFDSYKSVYDSLGDLPKTMVPHAPYSVSKTLFRLLNEINAGKDSVTSIHNQETVDEDLLYQSGGGGFVRFWESFGFDMEHFQSTGEASVFYAMEHMDREHQVLFIHNTCMQEDHVRHTLQWNPRSFFVTCPNANLFIENHLPDYQNFLKAGATLCIGTDSLSSNWHLSILEEVKTILKYHSFIDLEMVLGWATWNGASALKLDGLGAFQQGFTPGVNWIQSIRVEAGKCKLQPDARVRKIA